MIEDSENCFTGWCVESYPHNCKFKNEYQRKLFLEGLKKRVTELLEENENLLIRGACRNCANDAKRLEFLVKSRMEDNK